MNPPEVTHVQIPVKVIEAAMELLRHATFHRHTFDEAGTIIGQLKMSAEQSFAEQRRQQP